jgi:hypothetical protein
MENSGTVTGPGPLFPKKKENTFHMDVCYDTMTLFKE